jgi:hypothetical protein
MKHPKIGEGWKFRDKVPENKNEIIQLFRTEVKEFKKWIDTVSPKRKESIFWECDYDEQLYLDIAIQLIFENFEAIHNLQKKVINEIIFVIARNHEQGNILAWKNPETEISYLKMDETQFRFLAKKIEKAGEPEAKFQVAFVYRKLKSISEKDKDLLTKLAKDSNEYVRQQSLITLERLENNELKK